MSLSDQLREFVQQLHGSASVENARTNHANRIGVSPSAISVICTRDTDRTGHGNLRDLPPDAVRWSSDAVDLYDERMAIAEEMNLSCDIGSDAWCTAVREARRCAAGLSIPFPSTRAPGILDYVLESFAPLGRLTVTEIRASPRDADGTPHQHRS